MDIFEEFATYQLRVKQEGDLFRQKLIAFCQENNITGQTGSEESEFEAPCPLSTNPGIFKGKKPTGIQFAEEERLYVSSWKMVAKEILSRCDQDPERHVKLMNLRGKVSGRERIILSNRDDEMRSPIKIAENLYFESHYDTETLLRTLMKRVLDVVHFDYKHITVFIRNDSAGGSGR